MNEYEYKATGLIAGYFEENSIPYRICQREELEEVVVEFNVEAGPSVQIHYVIGDNDNDLSVLLKLINAVPSDKRIQMLEACNDLNRKKNHVCFFLDDHNDVVISYDFLMAMADESLGEAAHEMLLRIKILLDDNYSKLMKALYQPEQDVKVRFDGSLIKLLSGFDNQNEDNNDNKERPESDENAG